MLNRTTVTRNQAEDTFTYQHQLDKEPTTTTMKRVFQTGARLIELHDKTEAALFFLMNALEAHANTGEPLDEYGVRGLSALCGCVSDSIASATVDYSVESRIIKEMAAQLR